ncbi:hypothetical protein FH972_022090 [Carpinus fangiana]|uniref:Uncharacterized protein n=1 Tax=Carpinus fangiana TaxID=176857 RepID=A0A5N6KRV5_9ROSI|nr:hypothetical protein FH972_022090 [Carpinus fangiana]
MSVQEPDSAFSFESHINDYLNNAVHSQDTSEEERACIVKIQRYLLETLQEAGDAGEKELHALAMLPFRLGDLAENFQVGAGSEDVYEDRTFHEQGLGLLHKGPDEADTAMEQRPLAARGASAGEALESWVPAPAMWMSNNGFRVADEVYKNELLMKTDGPPPRPLAKKKGIKSTDITLKRWKFWKDSFQKVWDRSIEYYHGPNAQPDGRSLIETGLAAKEGTEAMEKAESLQRFRIASGDNYTLDSRRWDDMASWYQFEVWCRFRACKLHCHPTDKSQRIQPGRGIMILPRITGTIPVEIPRNRILQSNQCEAVMFNVLGGEGPMYTVEAMQDSISICSRSTVQGSDAHLCGCHAPDYAVLVHSCSTARHVAPPQICGTP